MYLALVKEQRAIVNEQQASALLYVAGAEQLCDQGEGL